MLGEKQSDAVGHQPLMGQRSHKTGWYLITQKLKRSDFPDGTWSGALYQHVGEREDGQESPGGNDGRKK